MSHFGADRHDINNAMGARPYNFDSFEEIVRLDETNCWAEDI